MPTLGGSLLVPMTFFNGDPQYRAGLMPAAGVPIAVAGRFGAAMDELWQHAER